MKIPYADKVGNKDLGRYDEKDDVGKETDAPAE
jgi:hypothetical protein